MTIAKAVAEPCVRPCLHRECRRMRDEANDRCQLCREPIGYGRVRVIERYGATLHWACVVDAVRRQAQATK